MLVFFESSTIGLGLGLRLVYITHNNNTCQWYVHNMHPLFTQCDRTTALDEFYGVVEADGDEFIQNIGIIGAGCSVATIPIAEISHYYNIPMVGLCVCVGVHGGGCGCGVGVCVCARACACTCTCTCACACVCVCVHNIMCV